MTLEEILTEIKETEIGKSLRSRELYYALMKSQKILGECVDNFAKALSKEQKDELFALEDLTCEYVQKCELDSFYYGFKLGQLFGKK